MSEIQKKVSVAICVKNMQDLVGNIIESLLRQTVTDFEIIIVDDMSSDNTEYVIKQFSDRRIKYYRNEKWLGISKSRNRCINYSKGEFIFFTDGDCTVQENWIEQGLNYFSNFDCVGVEGIIYYVKKDYEPTFSDYIMQNSGGNYMTGNMAYKKSIIEKIGGFDEEYSHFEDRDFAMRAMKLGKILLNKNMIVNHAKTVMTPKQYVKRGKKTQDIPKFYKKFHDKSVVKSRIFRPLELAAIFFPPLIFGSMLRNKFKTKEDFGLLPFLYLKLLYERINLWNSSVRNKIFLL